MLYANINLREPFYIRLNKVTATANLKLSGKCLITFDMLNLLTKRLIPMRSKAANFKILREDFVKL